MPLFVYQCDTCKRTEEKFRRIEDRAKEFECSPKLIDPEDKWIDGNENRCKGTMKFRPIQKTTFRFPGDEREAQG